MVVLSTASAFRDEGRIVVSDILDFQARLGYPAATVEDK